jgi:hypothetical protein
MDSSDPVRWLRERLLGVEPVNELDHYTTCPVCGQAIDLRKIAELIHHDAERHEQFARTLH